MPLLCFATSNLKRKYFAEILIFVFLCVLVISIFGAASFVLVTKILTPDPYNPKILYYWLVPLLGLVLLFYALKNLAGSIQEIGLYRKTIGKEILVADGRILFSIGLLEGAARTRLLKEKKPYLDLVLDQIKKFQIDPVKTRAGGEGHTSLVPAYYIISPANSCETVYVLRDPLKAQEKALIGEIQPQLKFPIIFKDELR